MRPAFPEQSVTDRVSAGDEVWDIPGSSVGHGEQMAFIQRALGSHGRVLSWSVTGLAMLPPVFPLWLLHGVWIEDRESGIEEPSAVKVE